LYFVFLFDYFVYEGIFRLLPALHYMYIISIRRYCMARSSVGNSLEQLLFLGRKGGDGTVSEFQLQVLMKEAVHIHPSI
jgi:hypothetical protein